MSKKRKHMITVDKLVDNLIQHYDTQQLFTWERKAFRMWRGHLKPFFSGLDADKLTTDQQRKYRTQREQEGASVATINREIGILCRAYKVGHRHEPPLVRRLPYFLRVPENNARLVFIEDDDLAKIRQAALNHPLWIRAVIELAYTLGWRRSEFVRLRVQDFNPVAGRLRLITSKNKDPRIAKLDQELTAMLRALIVGKGPGDQLFCSDVEKLKEEWMAIREEAGLTGKVRFHDFRRTSAREKLAAGIPQHVVMKIQGWRTEAMFRRYAIVAENDLDDAAVRMQAHREMKRSFAQPA